jgi:hypothetical protein
LVLDVEDDFGAGDVEDEVAATEEDAGCCLLLTDVGADAGPEEACGGLEVGVEAGAPELTTVIDATAWPSASENDAPTPESLQQLPDARFLSQQYWLLPQRSIASLPAAVLLYVQICGHDEPQFLSAPALHSSVHNPYCFICLPRMY